MDAHDSMSSGVVREADASSRPKRRMIPFLKMHGAGNDFVVIDHRRRFLVEDALEAWVARMCDRRRGIGADGVLLLESDPDLDFAMRYFNADGRPAEYCGNGARCLALLAFDLGLGSGGTVRFRTSAGVQSARPGPDRRGIELHFGAVTQAPEPCAVEVDGQSFEGCLITAGVPHFVTPVERVEWVPVGEWGAALRHHPRFGAAGANVDFVARLNHGRIAMRTYERGVEAETLACGTGAVASAALLEAWGVAESPLRLATKSGRTLVVRNGRSISPSLSGEAVVVFAGTFGEI